MRAIDKLRDIAIIDGIKKVATAIEIISKRFFPVMALAVQYACFAHLNGRRLTDDMAKLPIALISVKNRGISKLLAYLT